MRIIGTISGIVFAIVTLLGMTWLFQGNDFFVYQYFGPKYEQTRRTIFEQSKAYNQGMVQELQNMQFQYVQADTEHKDALADLILHRAADFDFNDPRVPSDLRRFVSDLRAERAGRKL
jgi:hypothetical protein